MDQVFNLFLIADLALVVFPSMHSIGRTSFVLNETEYHFDEFFITGCTRNCQIDNFLCSQWWKLYPKLHFSFNGLLPISGDENVIKKTFHFSGLLSFLHILVQWYPCHINIYIINMLNNVMQVLNIHFGKYWGIFWKWWLLSPKNDIL